MWPMHGADVQNCLGDRDAHGRNVKRPIARASTNLSGVVRVFERILRHTDHGNLAIERFVEMNAQSGTAISIQPNVAVDHDASRWLIEFCQHHLDARQLSTIEFAGLIFLHLMDRRHMLGDWDRSVPVVNDNACRSRCTIRVAYIDTCNRLGLRRVLHLYWRQLYVQSVLARNRT